jgi:hypothetical protein
MLTINDFLAITRPVNGNILVAEGWIWDSPAIREASEEFNRGHYKWLVIVGEFIGGGEGTTDQKDSAELAARQLREFGVDENLIIVLPVPDVTLHRTYASALALRNWLTRSKTTTTGVNVFTRGAHARKSLVLFKRALGPGTNVGVIAGTEDTYNASRWWLSARGIYVIMRKTLGYLYAVVWPLPESLPVSYDSGVPHDPPRPTNQRSL